ncbi:MAG: tetratricopeptide repeat protein, partial [Myxococcota bacterium]|nr:tetratricopeptide repeat protein [Myxococcota bacterium]
GIWIALLEVHTEYELDGGLPLARQALAQVGFDPEVVVAAVQCLEQAGALEEAARTLDEAWRRLPGDRDLRKARVQRGMSLETGEGEP